MFKKKYPNSTKRIPEIPETPEYPNPNVIAQSLNSHKYMRLDRSINCHIGARAILTLNEPPFDGLQSPRQSAWIGYSRVTEPDRASEMPSGGAVSRRETIGIGTTTSAVSEQATTGQSSKPRERRRTVHRLAGLSRSTAGGYQLWYTCILYTYTIVQCNYGKIQGHERSYLDLGMVSSFLSRSWLEVGWEAANR